MAIKTLMVNRFLCAIKKHIQKNTYAFARGSYESIEKWYSDVISKPETVCEGKKHKQYRNWQINQPLFDGRGDWKDLSADELSFINSIGGSMLAEFSYTTTDG